MAEPTFSSAAGYQPDDDDLPRTLRRERDAQARRARENQLENSKQATTAPNIAPERVSHDLVNTESDDYDEFDAPATTVTRLDIPFLHLMFFFIKAVLAGIPALVLLLAILWGIGEVITATFPELIKMQVLIRMPN